MARTQQQRREETVARLLDASIATIIEVGYARASAAVITKRAGVSVGALFRHFDTMGDFMAATASEVLRRQLESFTKRVAEIPADQPVLEAVLGILRDLTSGPVNAVIYELTVAARTDESSGDFATRARAVRREDRRGVSRAARRRGFPGRHLPGAGGADAQRVRRRRGGGRCAAATGNRGAADPGVDRAAERRAAAVSLASRRKARDTPGKRALCVCSRRWRGVAGRCYSEPMLACGLWAKPQSNNVAA